MITRVLARFDLPDLSCMGLLLFLAVFLGAWFWVFRRDRRALYGEVSHLPLYDLKPIPPGEHPNV